MANLNQQNFDHLFTLRKLKVNVEMKQPYKCVGCVWGRWDGTKQFCSRVVCVKDKS